MLITQILVGMTLTFGALDPSATYGDLREHIRITPSKGEFIVGTATGEADFSFELFLEKPAFKQPKIITENFSLSFSDRYFVAPGSYMKVGDKTIPLGCASFFAVERKAKNTTSADPKNFGVEVVAREARQGCDEETPPPSSNWLRFSYQSNEPEDVRGVRFSHLHNKFEAVNLPTED